MKISNFLKKERVSEYMIEDDTHSEWQKGSYKSPDEALIELQRRAKISWDKEPNTCPCTSWKTCHRSYVILEYKTKPWEEISRTSPILDISSKGVTWLVDTNSPLEFTK